MKIALSSRQTPEYLRKADEIRVQYRDREIIYDFAQDYPDKTIILEIPFYVEEDTVNFNEISNLNTICPNFICRISRLEDVEKLEALNIDWYYGMVIDKWEDLVCLAETRSKYVLIGGDLFFNLPKVTQFKIPIRAVPNVSSTSLIYPLLSDWREDMSIVGNWFQPEAMSIYEEYIAAIEFENCSLQRERAFYRIWTVDGWPGDLTMIITNLKTKAEGRLINPEWFNKTRLDCGRRCLTSPSGTCQICFRQFSLANYERLKEYKEEVIDKESTD